MVWIWFENHSYSDIIGSSSAPYFNSLASECGVATNYHNLSHPSLPNYVGATSGLAVSSLKPFDPDCNPSKKCSSSGSSIFGQGETWKAYEESMPTSATLFNHYSLLATAEQLLGLPALGQAASATTMTGAFHL